MGVLLSSVMGSDPSLASWLTQPGQRPHETVGYLIDNRTPLSSVPAAASSASSEAGVSEDIFVSLVEGVSRVVHVNTPRCRLPGGGHHFYRGDRQVSPDRPVSAFARFRRTACRGSYFEVAFQTRTVSDREFSVSLGKIMKIAQALLKHVARARISEYSRRARWRREVSSTSGHARSTSPNPRSAHRTEATNENRDYRVAGVSTHRRGTSWLAWSAHRGSALACVRSWHRTGGYPRDTPFRRARKEAVKTKLTAGSSPLAAVTAAPSRARARCRPLSSGCGALRTPQNA
jgi:hypothetical protein